MLRASVGNATTRTTSGREDVNGKGKKTKINKSFLHLPLDNVMRRVYSQDIKHKGNYELRYNHQEPNTNERGL